MPTLREPTSGHVTQVPQELVGTSSRTGVTNAERVRVIDIPNAPGGNTTNDHLKNIYARLGSFHGDGEWQGTYSNTATYAVGDEVDWTDGSDNLLFFKCILAGDDAGTGTPLTNTNRWIPLNSDIHDLAVVRNRPPDGTGVLERLPNGTIQFNQGIWNDVASSIDEDRAEEIALEIADQIVKTSRWRGDWAAGTNYRNEDFVTYNSVYYLRTGDGSDGAAENPAVNSGDWVRSTGTELLIARRLEDVSNLLAESLTLTPAEGNRGRWLARTAGAETYAYVLPPMQFLGNWSAATTYFYGSVVVSDGDTWFLGGTDQITTGKTGSGTAPGTDTDWIKLVSATSSLAGFPRYRGEWADANGETTLEGDIWKHNEGYYIRRTGTADSPETINTGGSGPDTDPTNYALIDAWDDNGWNTTRWYHEGTMLRHKEEVFIADRTINSDDPEPAVGGEFSSTIKWRQITGITPAMVQLRKDLEDQIHSADTARGRLQSSLALPVASDSTSLVWLARKSTRRWGVPASLRAGLGNIDQNVGDEPGEYKLTQGTVNRARLLCDKHTVGTGADARDWFGVITRAENHKDYPADFGSWVHSPVGGGVITVAAEQVDATNWKWHVMVKEAIIDAIFRNANPAPTLHIKGYSNDGTAQTAIAMTAARPVYIFNDVSYYAMVSANTTTEPWLKTIYDARDDANDDTRTIDISFTFGTNGGGVDAWLGNNQYGYTRQPPIATTDDIEVVSEDVHDIEVIARADYNALLQLAPRTMYLVHGSA